MFGCDSLNGERMQSLSAEIARTLVNGGQARTEAERVAQMLVDRHAESNRDVMRRVFVNTPAIYGFSSVAPVGATAGPILSRYLQAASASEVGSGRPNRKLLAHFSAHSMTMTPGLRDNDPRAAQRAEVCRFVDDRLTPPQKLGFIHAILQRDAAQARMFLDRIERFLASLTDDERTSSCRCAGAGADCARRSVARALSGLRPQHRHRVGAGAHDRCRARAGMAVRRRASRRDGEDRARPDVAAASDQRRRRRPGLQAEPERRLRRRACQRCAGRRIPTAGQAAALACLGSDEDRDRMLQALSSANERDIEMAEVYFHHRPIADAEELRVVTGGIVKLGQDRCAGARAARAGAPAGRRCRRARRARAPVLRSRSPSPCSGRSRACSSAPITARSQHPSSSACSASTGRQRPPTTSSTC